MQLSDNRQCTIPRDFLGLVFDLDGTIVDSAPALELILNQMRIERRLPPLPVSSYREWSSVGGLSLIQNALGVCSVEAEGLLLDFRHRYSLLQTPQHSSYNHVKEILLILQERGMPMAICSNKPRELCFKVLGDLGLLAFFPIIIAGDTLPFRKPDGRVLENTIQLMGLERHSVLFVGDSSVDFETAKNADVRFIYFEGGYGNGVAVEACYRSFSCYENFIGVIGLEG